MLQAVLDKDTVGIIIRGEFFELDKLYFLNERLAGTYGINSICLLEGYQEATVVLKSLNYEIRHAEHGDRDLYLAYNGIRKDWFAPKGTPDAQIVKEENANDPQEIIDEIEDAVMMDLDMDLEEFYDMDEDEQCDALEELNLDYDDIEVYLSWLHKDQTWFFKSEDYPDFSENNTYLQFRIPFAEGLLYAMIYRDLLSKKAEFIEKMIQQAKKSKNELRDYELDFCRRRLPSELLLAEMLMTQLFSCVYEAVGDDDYEKIEQALPLPGTFKNMTADDILQVEQITIEYPEIDVTSILKFMNRLISLSHRQG